MYNICIISKYDYIKSILSQYNIRYNVATSLILKNEYDLVIFDDSAIGEDLFLKNQDRFKKDKSYIRIGYDLEKPIEINNLILLMEKKLNLKNRKIIYISPYLIDLEARIIKYDDVNVTITEKESLLIEYLSKADSYVSRSILLKDLWGYNNKSESHTVETHIYQLRQKLNPLFPIIETQKDGYKLRNNTHSL